MFGVRLAEFCLIIILVMVLCSCDNSVQDTPQSNITNISATQVWQNSCGGGPSDPCSYVLRVSFDDITLGEHWYRGRLECGVLTTLGKILYVPNHDGFTTLYDTLLAPYWDLYGNVDYNLQVRRYDSYMNALHDDSATESAQMTGTWHVGFFDNDCRVECCTDTIYTQNRWYALAYYFQNGIVGAQADYWMPGKPKMCAEGQSTEEEESWAYIDISDDNSPVDCWCQVGYLTVRLPGHLTATTCVYFEVCADTQWTVQTYLAPTQGEWLDGLGCYVDAYGKCYLYVNGYPIDDIPAPYWTGRTANRVDFTCEILHHETDMYGTSGNPMKWRNIQYNLGSNWLPLPASNFTCLIDDRAQWQSRIAGNEIHTYDLLPQ